MPSSDYSLRAHAIESLTQIKRPDVPWRVVIRNTAAVVLPLGIGMATGSWIESAGPGGGAIVKVNEDGSVTVHIGKIDMGTIPGFGIPLIVAEELGIAVRRLGAPRIPVGYAPTLEAEARVDAPKIAAAARAFLRA